ncbi:MAG: ABC transporter substrate-binding protein [Oscillospiraceae bacterium]|nr:ABC transporter substrate-binding protein [Oscillospiraceae bacterium]
MLVCLLGSCGQGATSEVGTPSDETTPSSEAAPAATSDHANEITVGIPQDLDDSLDPYMMTAAGTREVMFNVFEGLVKPNSDGAYVNAVASDVQISDDLLTYTFTLRDGVVFHNGKTVTVDDVLYSFETCAATTVQSSVAAALSAITDIHADGNDIVITLSTPNSDFLANVSSVYITPADYDQQASQPVGTGPFKYVSRSVQENVVLEKNADYYGTPAYLDKVTYKIYEESNSMVTALNSGALDLVAHLTADQISTVSTDYTVLESTMNLVVALYLNHSVAPFDNEQVRQALCYAIDIDNVIALATSGHGVRIGSSMYPNFSKYFDESLADAYPYDPDQARQLLADAGYENGFIFSITIPSNYEHPYGDMALAIVENLQDVGITAKIKRVDWSTWLEETYSNRNFDSTIVGFDASILTASALLERWNSDAPNNMINYDNPEYDSTYAAAVASTDDAEQTALFKRCLEILNETAANVYIEDLGEFIVMNPELSGYEFYPLYVMDMSTLHF